MIFHSPDSDCSSQISIMISIRWISHVTQDKLPLQFPDALEPLKPKIEQFCSDAAGDDAWQMHSGNSTMTNYYSSFKSDGSNSTAHYRVQIVH